MYIHIYIYMYIYIYMQIFFCGGDIHIYIYICIGTWCRWIIPVVGESNRQSSGKSNGSGCYIGVILRDCVMQGPEELPVRLFDIPSTTIVQGI